jgi:predicted RND superfamily exporter protein
MNFIPIQIAPLWLVLAGVALAYSALALVRLRPGWVVDHAKWVLAVFALISLASAVALIDPATWKPRVRLDASEEPLMVRGDPAREIYAEATRTFGNDDIYVIAMLTDGDVFTHENLSVLRRISHAVLKLPGVRRARAWSTCRCTAGTRPRSGSTSRASSTISRPTRRRSPTCAGGRSPIRSIPS